MFEDDDDATVGNEDDRMTAVSYTHLTLPTGPPMPTVNARRRQSRPRQCAGRPVSRLLKSPGESRCSWECEWARRRGGRQTCEWLCARRRARSCVLATRRQALVRASISLIYAVFLTGKWQSLRCF